MSQVTAKLESVVCAHQIEQKWINETESEVLFQASDPTEPSPGLISSDWIRADRDEEDQQRLLAPVWRFLEYLPSNFVATEVGSRVQSFDVKRSYTMPVRQANLQIDDTCHEKLFRLAQAENVEQFTEAAKQLNLLKPDAETEAELLSVARLRTLLTELAMIFVLRRPFHGHKIIRTCGSTDIFSCFATGSPAGLGFGPGLRVARQTAFRFFGFVSDFGQAWSGWIRSDQVSIGQIGRKFL